MDVHCPMGGCISPTSANISFNHHEITWLDNDPSEFKPVLYMRYVDDTFLLFRQHYHIKLFFDNLNFQHKRIKYTCQVERKNSLYLLDVNVKKVGNKF